MEIVGVVVATLVGWMAFAVSTAFMVERILASRDARNRRSVGSMRGRRRRR